MSQREKFERLILPHLDAAYNLARWLLRDAHAAEDASQEACLRALRYADTLRGDDARPWLLGIVRNHCFTLLEREREGPRWQEWDDEAQPADSAAARSAEPSALLQRAQTRQQVDAAIRALPPPLREVIVLRELEGLDYAQIAQIAGVPAGTVMSRLARARARLRVALSALQQDEHHEP